MKRILVLAACAALGGCVSTASVDLTGQPIAKSQARLALSRSDDLLYLAAPATVTLDGRPVADLARGGRTMLDIEKGPHRLEVTTFSAPGRFSVTFTAEAGKIYPFEISPRGESFGVYAVAGVIGGMLDAAVNENSGPFKIVPKQS